MNRIRRAPALVAVIVITIVGALSAPAFAKSDRQIAKASTLLITDLGGTGWKAKPHTDEPDSKLASCAPTNKAHNAAKKYGANAPDFVNSDGAKITNAVYVFPSVKQAKVYLAAFKLPTALECIQQGLDDALRNTPGTTAKIGEIDVTGGPFDDGVGFAGVITGVATSGSASVDVYMQAVAFRVGRAVTGFTTANPGAVYPDTEQLVVTEIKRLKKNLK